MPFRDSILNNIRLHLGRQKSDKQAIEAAYQQLTPHPLRQAADNLVDAFQYELELLAGQVTRVKKPQDCVDVVLDVLSQHQSEQLLISQAELCAQIEWPKNIKTQCQKAQDSDKVALSCALAGIAETGSIVMSSSPQTPTSHNFLVDDHIVLLPASRIFSHLESMWHEFDKQAMPRTVNVLTGPSRTGDVEQTIQIGAHGPLRFHVIIIESAS